jgi:hypothetical protein
VVSPRRSAPTTSIEPSSIWGFGRSGPASSPKLAWRSSAPTRPFILKYIVLASLYDPHGGLAKRVLMTLLEGVTLGGLQYESPAALTGYIAFFTLALYLTGVMLLPHPMLQRALPRQISS